MNISIIGSTGQLGTDLMKMLKNKHQVTGLTHHDIEVVDYTSCLILKKQQPDIIINTAAFHNTDRCEEEPQKSFAVNALGARNIATISKEIGAIVVFISTDYVFDGSREKPYTEYDVPLPINTYGISKLAGELYTRQIPKHYIIRVASLFGVAGASGKGGNFVETMIAKAEKNEPITVVNDMWMSPTYTKDAAIIIEQIIDSKLPFGIYHAVNHGYCTWFQLAKETLNLIGLIPILKPIGTNQLTTKAKRPRFSALRSMSLPKYDLIMREWNQALYAYLVEKRHILD